MRVVSQVVLDRETLPVLAEGDLLVVGGSFAGIAAAIAMAEAGRKVILVDSRTYLGREATAYLRPWLVYKEGESIPDLVRSCIESAGIAIPEKELISFKLSELKTHLEDRLLELDVKILYASLPVGLVLERGMIAGVIFGNKSGRQVIRAHSVLDTSETGLLFRMIGDDQIASTDDTALFYRTLEFDRVGAVTAGWLTIPKALGIVDNQVRLIPGAKGRDYILVECPLLLPKQDKDAFDLTKREIEARQKTMALAAHLRKHVEGFEKAYLASASQLLIGPLFSGRFDDDDKLVNGSYEPVLKVGYGFANLPIAKTTGPLRGLFGLPEHLWQKSIPNDRVLLAASAVGEAFGRRLGEMSDDGCTREDNREFNFPKVPAGLPNLHINEPASPQHGREYPIQPISPVAVPIVRTVDVLVVGGGTSGATAAYVAAKAGAKVLLVEAGPGLGGTGTIGGVHSYWFGRRVGFSRQLIDSVEAMHAELGLDPPEGGLLKWNIEAKMHALLQRALNAGVELLWGAIATGAVLEGQQVRGVIVATPLGPVALHAKVVIDTTGDGDVAFFAGAQAVYGAARDHTTMWYSLAQFYRPGLTQNNFTSTVDVGNVEDYTRAILAGRRRAKGHDQGTYVAPRESRHILADVILTLNDQLIKRCWPDTVYVAFSNHDIKGHSSSDWLRVGLIPPNLEVEIPYRAVLPRGLEGILVAGKAFSATHDALPAIRMQPDLENLGGMVGTAAALAVKTGCSPRQVDVHTLQLEMVAANVLPETILQRTLRPMRFTPEDLQRSVDKLASGKLLNSYQDMELDVVFDERIPFVDLCCAGTEVLPILQSALEKSKGQGRVLIAKALAMIGSPIAVPDLIAALQSETLDEGLQSRKTHIRHVQLPPDQGAMPEAANLLYALGMTRDERALPVWNHFSSLVSETNDADIRDRNLGLFYYVDAICFGAERKGDPRAVPYLKRMHDSVLFWGRSSPKGFEPDFFLERQAYLELVIARALARCGDRDGFDTLISYLDDARALLAEHAHTELQIITGQDIGKDRYAWLGWLSQTESWRVPHPIDEPNEPVQSWLEEIFLCE